MEITEMTIEQLQERKRAIAAELDADGVDLTSLEEEVRALNVELESRKAEEAKKAELRQSVADGAGEVIKNFAADNAATIEKEERKMFDINSVEYRNAWLKNLFGREMSAEERTALTSAAAVIPTMTVNAVWDKLIKPAEMLGKVDVSQFPSYVRFPVATTVNAAAAGAVGGTISESGDVVGYVDLIPNEYVKAITVGADIDNMSIDALHTWLINNIVESIRYAINKDILVGSGTNSLKGLTASVTASATAIPATLTKAALLKIMAALGSNYQNGAVWIMTPSMFYEEVMGLTALEDYVINDGFEFKLFGHDVVLMSEALVSDKETIFYGDPKAYKLNIFKAIEVKPFETATTTNVTYRGATMADGELIDTAAFVRFARA